MTTTLEIMACGAVDERLNDVVMQVPPLRERRDDIPLLLDHFRDLYNRQHGFAVTGLTAEAMAAMTGYGWTGNARALTLFNVEDHAGAARGAVEGRLGIDGSVEIAAMRQVVLHRDRAVLEQLAWM